MDPNLLNKNISNSDGDINIAVQYERKKKKGKHYSICVLLCNI